MGKLIKTHWARLITLAAAAYHVAATLEAFFWPKCFFDPWTKNFDAALYPIPVLQIVNLVLALATAAFEWPLTDRIARSRAHACLSLRLFALPGVAIAALLLYQATNAALYYMVATGVYAWAYVEGETVCATPWTLPARKEQPSGRGEAG